MRLLICICNEFNKINSLNANAYAFAYANAYANVYANVYANAYANAFRVLILLI